MTTTTPASFPPLVPRNRQETRACLAVPGGIDACILSFQRQPPLFLPINSSRLRYLVTFIDKAATKGYSCTSAKLSLRRLPIRQWKTRTSCNSRADLVNELSSKESQKPMEDEKRRIIPLQSRADLVNELLTLFCYRRRKPKHHRRCVFGPGLFI